MMAFLVGFFTMAFFSAYPILALALLLLVMFVSLSMKISDKLNIEMGTVVIGFMVVCVVSLPFIGLAIHWLGG